MLLEEVEEENMVFMKNVLVMLFLDIFISATENLSYTFASTGGRMGRKVDLVFIVVKCSCLDGKTAAFKSKGYQIPPHSYLYYTSNFARPKRKQVPYT